MSQVLEDVTTDATPEDAGIRAYVLSRWGAEDIDIAIDAFTSHNPDCEHLKVALRAALDTARRMIEREAMAKAATVIEQVGAGLAAAGEDGRLAAGSASVRAALETCRGLAAGIRAAIDGEAALPDPA